MSFPGLLESDPPVELDGGYIPSIYLQLDVVYPYGVEVVHPCQEDGFAKPLASVGWGNADHTYASNRAGGAVLNRGPAVSRGFRAVGQKEDSIWV